MKCFMQIVSCHMLQKFKFHMDYHNQKCCPYFKERYVQKQFVVYFNAFTLEHLKKKPVTTRPS